jgi:hypothetical protein
VSLLPRIQWFEFTDQSWLPSVVHHAITRTITFDVWCMGSFRGELPRRFARWLERTGASEVLDIGSGSAGPVLALVRGLRRQGVEPPVFYLSDLYPDVAHFVAISDNAPKWANSEGHSLGYVREPVDALAGPVPRDHEFFTLINIAHHFPPATLKRILANLVRQGRGVFLADTFYRSVRFVPLILSSLVASWGAPLIVRPFSWAHLLLGTVIPIVPFLTMHDAMVSVLRGYNPDEWRAMVAELPPNDFRWEIDCLPAGTVYVAGWRP